jgi:hypothetical protein
MTGELHKEENRYLTSKGIITKHAFFPRKLSKVALKGL